MGDPQETTEERAVREGSWTLVISALGAHCWGSVPHDRALLQVLSLIEYACVTVWVHDPCADDACGDCGYYRAFDALGAIVEELQGLPLEQRVGVLRRGYEQLLTNVASSAKAAGLVIPAQPVDATNKLAARALEELAKGSAGKS